MYQDRFAENRYRNDEPVELALIPDPPDHGAERSEVHVSERLFDRLRYLALAYELPLLGRLPQRDEWTFPEIQFVPIVDELLYLLATVSDPLLAAALEPLLIGLNGAIRSQRGWTLLVSRP